jgi:hypothetical protein
MLNRKVDSSANIRDRLGILEADAQSRTLVQKYKESWAMTTSTGCLLHETSEYTPHCIVNSSVSGLGSATHIMLTDTSAYILVAKDSAGVLTVLHTALLCIVSPDKLRYGIEKYRLPRYTSTSNFRPGRSRADMIKQKIVCLGQLKPSCIANVVGISRMILRLDLTDFRRHSMISLKRAHPCRLPVLAVLPHKLHHSSLPSLSYPTGFQLSYSQQHRNISLLFTGNKNDGNCSNSGQGRTRPGSEYHALTSKMASHLGSSTAPIFTLPLCCVRSRLHFWR